LLVRELLHEERKQMIQSVRVPEKNQSSINYASINIRHFLVHYISPYLSKSFINVGVMVIFSFISSKTFSCSFTGNVIFSKRRLCMTLLKSFDSRFNSSIRTPLTFSLNNIISH